MKALKKQLESAYNFISQSIESKYEKKTQEIRLKAINEFESLLSKIDITEYLLIDSKPFLSKDIYIDCHFNLGTLLKNYVESDVQELSKELRKNEANRHIKQPLVLTVKQIEYFYKAIGYFNTILRVKFEDVNAIKQITSIYTQLCFFSQHDLSKCLGYLQEALFYAPTNETIHYNLGYIHQKLNKLELSIIHYKLSIELSLKDKEANKCLLLNNLNGISSIYRSIKQWPEALHFLLKAEEINNSDPDIQNQLGVVYTEMRRTDLAQKAYEKALGNYKQSFISTDLKFFHSEILLNLGHMYSYNGDNEKAVEHYNKSLQISPTFLLPFQNKIMNLSYLFDQLEDKMYILNQHKLVNKLFAKGNGQYTFSNKFFETEKINIGIISGDFVDHPVSFFISTFLKNFDSSKFTVTCYSECLINTKLFNDNLQFKFIKNLSAHDASQLIHNDRVHILLDLAGHTAFNRLDVFALKPSPIQITYIGYPYSTGLSEMDYRITDAICDNNDVSSLFYTEKLLYLENCFLNYDPCLKGSQVPLTDPPFLKNGYLTIGCFNRLNKITDPVIKFMNKIALDNSSVRFLFKTKALLNANVKKLFLSKFSPQVQSRIRINDCTILHEDHLAEYNKVDIALDTFPYSGTTTSCEALYMGVPVFSLYDSTHFFHAQNVTCSLLKNSGLDFFVLNNQDEINTKLSALLEKDIKYWKALKANTRRQFLNGKVCNKEEYMNNIQKMFVMLYEKHTHNNGKK